MNEEIVKIRTKIVDNSTDREVAKDLLDALTTVLEGEFKDKQLFAIDRADVKESRDLDTHVIHATDRGYLLEYRGGMKVFVEDRLISPASILEMMMHPEASKMQLDSDEEREHFDDAISAAETIFRLPMFIFSHTESMYAISTIALRYMLLLQELGQVPTEEQADDPKVERFTKLLAETLDSMSEILESQAKEYKQENKMEEISDGKEKSENAGSDENEAEPESKE